MSVPWMNEEIVPRTIELDGETYSIEFREYSQLQFQAYYTPWYRDLWDDINDDASIWILTEIVIPALMNESFIVLQFYGKSNSGKSWLALAKAIEIKDLEEEYFDYKDVNIHFVFNHADISKLLRTEEAKKGDIIICDEESGMSGVGSTNAEQALANILSACRAKGVHFFFSDPVPKPKPNVDAWYCIAGIVRKAFTTISIIEDATNKPIGFDITKIPVDTDTWKKYIEIYNPLKMANIDRLLEQMGSVGANVSAEQEQDARELYDYAYRAEQNGTKITEQTLRVFSSDLNISAMGIAYENNVIARVKMLRDEKGGAKLRKVEYDDVTRGRWKITDVGSTSLPDDFLSQLEPFLYEQIPIRASDKSLNPNSPKWFTEYCSDPHLVYQDVAAKFGSSYGKVYSDLREIRQSVFGYALEQLLASQNPEWILGGGNLPLPDFVAEDRIISIKSRIRKNLQVSIQDFGKEEKRRAIKDKKPLWLYLYEIKYYKKIFYFLAELIPEDETSTE